MVNTIFLYFHVEVLVRISQYNWSFEKYTWWNRRSSWCSDGDIFMDVSQHTTWRELFTYTFDKDFWRVRVRGLRQPRVTIETGSYIGKNHNSTVSFSNWPPCCSYTPHAKSQGRPHRYCVWGSSHFSQHTNTILTLSSTVSAPEVLKHIEWPYWWVSSWCWCVVKRSSHIISLWVER